MARVFRDGRDPRLSRRVATYALSLAFAGGVFPACGHAKTLSEAVATALAGHPQVSAADAAARAVRRDVDQARAGYFPTLDVNLAGGRESTESPQLRALGAPGATVLNRRESGVFVNQKLFDGFATKSSVEQQRARAGSFEAKATDTREVVALRVVTVYLDILKNQQLVQLARENLAAHQQTFGKVQQRVRGGVSQKVDVQQVEARIALARSTLSVREGRLREAEVNYLRVVGELPRDMRDVSGPPPRLIKAGLIDAETVTQALREATETALARNPNVIAADADVAAAEAAKRGAVAAYMPRLDLELAANRNRNIAGFQGEYNNETAMLVMRWNLFRGLGDQAQDRAFAERYLAARDTATDTRRAVQENVAVAVNAKATSEERIAFLEQYVRSSAEALDSYQAQLDLGRRSLLDVLNAVNELFTARSNLVEGRYEDLLNYYTIEAAKGTLVMSI